MLRTVLIKMLLLKNYQLCIKVIIQKDDQTNIAQNMAIWKLQEKTKIKNFFDCLIQDRGKKHFKNELQIH